MKKILIAIDYGPTSQKIAEEGYKFAKSINAHIVIVHVIEEDAYYSTISDPSIMGFSGFTDADLKKDDKQFRKTAEDFLVKVKAYLKDDSIETKIKKGDPAEAILKAEKGLNVDLIIIGSHSRRWLETIIMGSVTEKVLNNSHIPLLIIPTKKK